MKASSIRPGHEIEYKGSWFPVVRVADSRDTAGKLAIFVERPSAGSFMWPVSAMRDEEVVARRGAGMGPVCAMSDIELCELRKLVGI